jgi:spore maturation protein CgeB
MRLLEVPACRVCLLTDVARDAARLLVPEEDFVWARNLAEMQAKLAALLTDEPRRLGIASRGYDKASRAFSYDNLVARILADWGRLPKFR